MKKGLIVLAEGEHWASEYFKRSPSPKGSSCRENERLGRTHYPL